MTERRRRRYSARAPAGPWDCVVIGSGMGGMTTAAIVAKAGGRVLLLEQHHVPGGLTQTFSRGEFRWDVGLHAVGDVTRRTRIGRVLARVTDGRLQWASLGKVCDELHYPDGVRIDIPDELGNYFAQLRDRFPAEREGIDRFASLTRSASQDASVHLQRIAMGADDTSLAPLMRATVAQVVTAVTDDPRLRRVLGSLWGYYGSPPSRASFAMHALTLQHLRRGGFYPRGGSRAVARELLRTVADAGGWTRVRAPVAEVVVDRGRARGVRLASGELILADTIVSAIGVPSTVERLLPGARNEPWARAIGLLPRTPAHVCLHLGLRADPRQAGASAANKWFFEDWSLDAGVWDPAASERSPLLYCSFPSLKDPGATGPHTATVVALVPWSTVSRFSGSAWRSRPAAYERCKQDWARRLLAQFLEHMPELAELVVHAELSTPLSTEHFCRPGAGAIYGVEPTPRRFGCRWLRPRSPIDGLYFSGSDVGLMGVGGAAMGGLAAAIACDRIGTLCVVAAA